MRRGCAARGLVLALALLTARCLVAAVAVATTVIPPDPGVAVGRVIPFDGFVDQDDRPFAAAAGDARPWIVSPIYTHCPNTCSAITAALKSALRTAGLKPDADRVLTFSFDPHEDAASLREFRQRLQLPEGWLTLRAADPAALQATLRALDFRTIQLDGGMFEHPNLVAVLTADQRLVEYVYGVTPAPDRLAAAVARARGGVSAGDAWRPYLFFFAALGFTASAAVFVAVLARRQRMGIPKA
jgi:protein SCO1/2